MAEASADEIKLEFEEDNEDLGSAKALMTLHNSVQNMPEEHKSVLQEAVHDASPMKRYRYDQNVKLSNHYPENSLELQNIHLRKQSCPSKMPSSNLQDNFTSVQVRTMKGLLNYVNNILKQSAGRRWVHYEWFYSNIDRALLLGENDFQNCLRQLFNGVNVKKLTRMQWSMIRRMMGKPRRCSPAFFEEERHSLEEKRKKIRYLHQLKGCEVTDITQFKDLPDEIPMPMVIGTKVTAKVNSAKDGLRLFTGTVDAVDNTRNSYRITFDREGIGTQSVPDIDVASNDYEAMNLQLFIIKERPRIAGATSPSELLITGNKRKNDDGNISGSARMILTEALNSDRSGTYGGFPIHFLLNLTQLTKILALKKRYIDKLKDMNSEVERRRSYKERLTSDFQKNYAFVVLELEKTNTKLNSTFASIHDFMHNTAPQIGLFDPAAAMRQYCDNSAAEMIEQSQRVIESIHMKDLVTKLTSLMLQMNYHAEYGKNSVELSSLDETMKEIKNTINSKNIALFEDKVETCITYIKNGLQGEGNMLSAFSEGGKFRQKVEKLHSVNEDEEEEEVEEEIEDVEDEMEIDDEGLSLNVHDDL